MRQYLFRGDSLGGGFYQFTGARWGGGGDILTLGSGFGGGWGGEMTFDNWGCSVEIKGRDVMRESTSHSSEDPSAAYWEREEEDWAESAWLVSELRESSRCCQNPSLGGLSRPRLFDSVLEGDCWLSSLFILVNVALCVLCWEFRWNDLRNSWGIWGFF